MKRTLIIIFGLIGVFFIFNACKKGKEQETADVVKSEEKIFMAGISKVNVTGKVPSGLTVHDSLYARSLVLDDGKNRLVFVVVDKTTVPREVFDEAKQLISSENNISLQNIMMAATHTHTATVTYFEGVTSNGFGYTQRFSWNAGRSLQPHQVLLARQIADGVKSAVENLEPAKIGWGMGSLPKWTHSRRWMMKTGTKNPFGGYDQVLYHPGRSNSNRDKPAGPVDPGIPFIAVQALDGSPISILANFSIHHAGDLKGIPEDHISADYWGVFSTKIAELVSADSQSRPFLGIISYGNGADITSYNYAYGVPAPANGPYVRVNAVANDVANEVYKIYKTIQYHNWVSLNSAQSELSIKIRRASPELLEYLKGRLQTPKPPQWHPTRDQSQAYMALQLEKEWPDQIPVILQVFKIGDVGICAVPFEVFAEMGLEIKSKSPFATTFVMGLANGSHGYLPTPRQHELGGYETWMGGSNKVQKEASVLITNQLLSMFNTLESR